MKNYTIIQTKKSKLIYKLADRFDADMHAIHTISLAWILKVQEEDKGIIGVNRWKRDFSTIDLFVSEASAYQDSIMNSLVRFIMKKAKLSNVRNFYCHMGSEKAKYFLDNNFKYVSEKNLPKDYFCSCHLCDDYNKSCFPKPLKWENL